jgi:two-component system, LytTR family, response regulator
MSLTALIIDDEQPAREALRALLSRYCHDVEVVGEAHSIDIAESLVIHLQPKLLFLDIEMPYGSGFDLLARFKNPPFRVVFTTGFDQYALNAIKFSALDYLLKPIDIEELKEAVKKAQQYFNGASNYQNLLSVLHNPGSQLNQLSIPQSERTEMVAIEKIVAFEAFQSHTIIHLDGGQKIKSTRNIKGYQELLVDYDFEKLENTYLVNTVQMAKTSDHLSVLSSRELEILQHLASGLSYKMVAATCNISIETVRTYTKRIYQKLGVHSVTEATAKFYRG